MTYVKLIPPILSLIALSIIACSQPDPEWTMSTPAVDQIEGGELQDTLVADSDTTGLAETAVNDVLDKAESFYAIGVHYYQVSKLDSAQSAFEQSLAILAELDLDVEQNPDQVTRMEGLLNEIEEDYRLTLIQSGKLSSEASITAFRELYSDLKNFKKLKETGGVAEFNEADTVIYDVDIEWNEKVENSLIYLQTVAREKFTTYLARSGAYVPMMEKILEKTGVPHDLVYLPLIESGFNASAYSYARASGFWQFISSTGRLYGLEHNWWFDERRDFEKSTTAAAEHLKDLYERFGSWNLALAAYNGGAGRVSREIKKAKTNDFWKLALHKQTKDYVPLFMAATIIARQPHKYGFFPEYERPIEFDTIMISKCLSFNNISAKTGFAVSELERLNPELLKGITPPDSKQYVLRVPKGQREVFAAVYNDIPSERATTVGRHKVKRGETLSLIAKKYGASLNALLQANNLSKNKKIYVGQLLTIPVPYGKGSKIEQPVVEASKKTSKKNEPKPIVKDSPNRYRVKNGDTLWEIASAYGVSIGDIKRLNGLNSNTVYAGRWLKIPESPQAASIQTAEVNYDIYSVKRGDNLSRIAGKHKVSMESIKAANNLTSNKLYPGMRLKIPAKGSSNTQYSSQKTLEDKKVSTKIYTVRRGDTLWKIAKNHGVELGNLAKWNNLSVKSRLLPGDKLKIYL